MESEHIKYIGFEEETCPHTGTRHLQGFMQLKVKHRLTWIRKNISTELHLSNMRGTFDENKAYCSKDGNFVERGAFTKKGERKDLNQVYEEIMEGTYQPGPEYIQYHSGIDKLIRKCSNDRAAKHFKDDFNAGHEGLNENQDIWLEHLEAQNDRQVTWVYDPVGNAGKSYFADWLLVNKDAILLTNAPTRDIAMAYDNQPVVVFDYSRDQESRINYGVIEQLKNGRIFSSKYESTTKLFRKPKIICFSNFNPDRSKLSGDRWDVIEREVFPDASLLHDVVY